MWELNNILESRHIFSGLVLLEDVHFVYLMHKGKQIAQFYASASKQEIIRAADEYLKATS